MNKKEIINMPSIAYISALSGFEIKNIEYEIDDYVIGVSGAWCSKKSVHRVKIYTTTKGRNFIRVNGTRLYLDEAIIM